MTDIGTIELDSQEINFGSLNGDAPSGIVTAANYTIEFYGSGLGTLPGSLFIWDFGDPIHSTTLNPNIVKVTNITEKVSHIFGSTGRYVIRFIEQRKDGILIETVRTITVASVS